MSLSGAAADRQDRRLCQLRGRVRFAAQARRGARQLLVVVKRPGRPLQSTKIYRFAAQPSVINGCSDLMGEVFGPVGVHARSAVGTNALPLNVPVEIEAIVEVGSRRCGSGGAAPHPPLPAPSIRPTLPDAVAPETAAVRGRGVAAPPRHRASPRQARGA
jgi:hypothetical protein